MRRFLFQSLTTVGCIAILAVLLLPAIEMATQNDGDLFPSDPREYRRTDTWLGVSIIRPDKWDISDRTLLSRAAGPDRYHSFIMMPYQCLSRRKGSSLFVHRSSNKPDFAGVEYSEANFKGRPAWQGYYVDSHNTLDYIPTYRIHVDDDGTWYTIGFSTTSKMDALPDKVREFLDSVRFDSDRDRQE